MTELTQKQQYWKTHIDELSSFDGTAVDYAKQHDLDAKKLYYFKSQIARMQSPGPTAPAFVRAEPSATASSTLPTAGVAVLLPNGVRLNLPSLDTATLIQLAQL